MPVDNTHALYDSAMKRVKKVRACIGGEEDVHALGTAALPKPSGIALGELSDDENVKKLAQHDWKNYKRRAEFHDLVGPICDGLLGLAFNKPWEIKLPPRLESLYENGQPVTACGLSMKQFQKRVVHEMLITPRIGLLSDVQPGTGPNPLISLYPFETVRNWRESEGDTIIVLSETKYEPSSTDRFSLDEVIEYRELRLNGNRYEMNLHQESSNIEQKNATAFIETPIPMGLQKGYIPFVSAGSQSQRLDPDKNIPAWPIARHLLKYFELSPDYYISMHMTAQPTLFLKMFGEDVPQLAGAMTTIHSNDPQSDGKYIEFSGNGVEAIKAEMVRQIELALFYSHFLVERSGVENSEALGLRVQSKTATLRNVVINAADSMEKAFRYCADWINANPDDVEVIPNLEFTDKEVDATLLTTIGNQVKSGLLPIEVYHAFVRINDLTEMADEELMELIEEQDEREQEKMAAMDIGEGPSNNLNNQNAA